LNNFTQQFCRQKFLPTKSEGGSAGGFKGGMPSRPERRTSARLRLLVKSRTPKAKFSFAFRRKNPARANQKNGEHFFAGHASGASGGGADSFVQFPLEKGSRKVYNYSTSSNFLKIKTMERFLQSKKRTGLFLSACGGSREIPQIPPAYGNNSNQN